MAGNVFAGIDSYCNLVAFLVHPQPVQQQTYDVNAMSASCPAGIAGMPR